MLLKKIEEWDTNPKEITQKLLELFDKLKKENKLEKAEYQFILKNISSNELEALEKIADGVNRNTFDSRVYLRGLIEFSNICSKDCLYCGIRKSIKRSDRYHMTEDEILECAALGYELGYRTFVLQSGEDPYFTDDRIVSIIKNLKSLYPECAITLGVGEKSKESYKAYFDSGCDRYLLRHETASKLLYEKLHPESMSFENRMRCLKDLKDIGYQVGAGFMVGLPYQTDSDLAEDFVFLQEFKPHMVGIGPFIAHSKTPLANFSSGTLKQVLVSVALVRLILPNALLPSTTALGTIFPKGREQALKSGANVVMPSIASAEFKTKYELYEHRICISDESIRCRGCIESRIMLSGYHVDLSRGDYPGMEVK